MLMDPKNLISEELRSLFVKGKPLIHKAVFERNYAALSMMTEEQLMLLKNKLPPCVKHVLGAVDKTGLGDLTFNDLHYQILIPYFRQTGMSAEEAADVCSDFFNEFTGSTRYTDAGARRQHFLEMWPQARDYEWECGIVRNQLDFKCQGCAIYTLELEALFREGDPEKLRAEGWIPMAEFEEKYITSLRDQTRPFFTRRGRDIDPNLIKPRPWIIKNMFLANNLNVIQAPGGMGKSTLANLIANAIVGNRSDLIGSINTQGSVFIYNAEDAPDEMDARLHYSAEKHGIELGQYDHDVLLESGYSKAITFAATDKRGGVMANESLFLDLVERFRRENIKLAFFDPLVSLHRCNENDNNEMNLVCRVLMTLARMTESAVVVIHHTNKAASTKSGDPESADAGRGASSVVGAARVIFNLISMDKKEAKDAGLLEIDRINYMRLHNSKQNLAPASVARWFQKVSVTMANGEDVGVAVPVELDFDRETVKEADGFDQEMLVDLVIEAVSEGNNGKHFTRTTLAKAKRKEWEAKIPGTSYRSINAAVEQALSIKAVKILFKKGGDKNNHEYLLPAR